VKTQKKVEADYIR